MREVGRLTEWKDEQGYGFITPKGGGDPVFVHIKSFSNRQQCPLRNDLVHYTLGFDERHRARAEDVSFVVPISAPVRSYGTADIILTFAVFFILFVVKCVADGRLPSPILALYLVVSTITFFMYWSDKSKARRKQWRIPEDTLHFWSLIGGWPGAALAQKLVHHKSSKTSFQTIYWFTIAVNIVAVIWLLSPVGSVYARSFIEASCRIRHL